MCFDPLDQKDKPTDHFSLQSSYLYKIKSDGGVPGQIRPINLTFERNRRGHKPDSDKKQQVCQARLPRRRGSQPDPALLLQLECRPSLLPCWRVFGLQGGLKVYSYQHLLANLSPSLSLAFVFANTFNHSPRVSYYDTQNIAEQIAPFCYLQQ